MMSRVAIDMRFLDRSGVGRYAAGIVRELIGGTTRFEYVLLRRPGQTLTDLGSVQEVIVRAPYYSITEQVYMPIALRRAGAALFHSPHFVLPLASSSVMISTIHDVAYLRSDDDLRTWKARLYYRTLMRAGAARARLVVTSSEFSKAEIVDVLGVPANRVVVIPGGVSPVFSPATLEQVSDARYALGVKPGPYFLYLGIHRRRKNLEALIKSYARLVETVGTEHALVLAGPQSDLTTELRDLACSLGIDGRVQFLGPVADRCLPPLITGATALLLLSTYEGFGLPVLEAMACGTPVICSSVASLPEVAGGAALLTDPYSIESISGAMARLEQSESLRGQLRTAGLERHRSFSWRHAAHLTEAMYESLL